MYSFNVRGIVASRSIIMLLYLAMFFFILGVGYVVFLELYVVRRKVAEFPSDEYEEYIRRKVTRDYMLGISRSNFLIIIVALATALIGAYSAQISFFVRNETRLYQELSLKPHLDVSFGYNETGAGFSISSDGLGPAIIKWTAVWVNGELQGTWDEVTSALFSSKAQRDYYFTNPAPGVSLKPGEPSHLYWFPPNSDGMFLKQNWGKVGIAICYCSIYGELDSTQCWETLVNVPSSVPPICQQAPPLIFPNKNQ